MKKNKIKRKGKLHVKQNLFNYMFDNRRLFAIVINKKTIHLYLSFIVEAL